MLTNLSRKPLACLCFLTTQPSSFHGHYCLHLADGETETQGHLAVTTGAEDFPRHAPKWMVSTLTFDDKANTYCARQVAKGFQSHFICITARKWELLLLSLYTHGRQLRFREVK